MHSLYGGAKARQLFLDPLVTAVEVVNAVDQRFALGDQGGDDQRSRGAQVGGHHRRAFQAIDAADDGVVALDLDVGPEAHQFVDVHEAVFENRFADGRHAIGNAVDGHELRLHVGRESRIGRRAQADRLQALGSDEADRIALDGNLAAGVHQLVDDGIEVGGRGLQQADVAASDRRGTEIGAGLDAVGHDRVRRAVQLVDALDADDVGAGAGDAGAHRDQAIGQVDHFRLTRGIFDDRFALGQASGHHQVLGAGHGAHVGADASALQAGRLGMDVALLDLDLGAHRLQTLDVLVNRPGADGTAAG